MTYILFLDDEREPSFVPELMNSGMEIKICRTYQSAVNTVRKFGVPAFISFDHDIASLDTTGKELTGYDFAKWLVNQELDGNLDLSEMSYHVHSMNPIGAKNIRAFLEGYYLATHT